MKKILVLEDDNDIVAYWCKKLSEFEIISATTILGAMKKFSAESASAWDAIVVDGHLANSGSGYTFAQFVRARGYTGVMIAASADEESQKELLAAGCSHAAPAKWEVPETVKQLLA